MTGQLFISLLNPGIGLLLGMAFWLLWLHQRDQTYVLVAAIGYGLSMVGFLIQDVFPPWQNELQRIPSNFLYLVSAAFIAAAVIGRYRIRVPVGLLSIFIAFGIGCHAWYFVVQPNITARVLVMGVALGAISWVIVFKLYRMPREKLADKLLFWLCVATAVNFMFRPIIIVALAGGFESYEGFQQSLYWSTVQFTQAMMSISFAVLLMVAVASDLISALKLQATTDQLSGLLNRRGFEEAAQLAIEASAHKGRPVGLLLLDFDHFKALNDNFGHAAGDRVIATFGEMVRETLLPHSIAGRIGGEEFCILVPNAEVDVLKAYAELIRVSVRSALVARMPQGAACSLSIGINVEGPGTTLSGLLSGADGALYAAKREGRDRVRVASGHLPSLTGTSADAERRAMRTA